MVRSFVAAAVVVGAWAAGASAQVPASVASGVGSFGGGFRPATPRFSAPAFTPYRPGFAGRNYGYGGYYSGGFLTGGYGNYGYGYGYAPYYVVPGPFDSYANDPGYAAPLPAPTPVFESGQLASKLTLQFPAAARVWLDGQEVAGDAATERTLTSPAIQAGGEYTFRVRARWEANGQTYEYTRDVPVGTGNNSRLLVVSGTAVK